MKIVVSEEIEKLRSAISKAEFASHVKLLEMLDDTDRRESILYVATLDYMATGEGRTLAVIAAWASCGSDFVKRMLIDLSGYYYVIGVDVYENVVPNDAAARMLVSPALRSNLQSQIEKPEQAGHLHVNLSYHIDFS